MVLVPLIALLSVLTMSVFISIDLFVVPDKGFIEGFSSLLVLLIGLVVVSSIVPFDNLLMVTGQPSRQTIQQLCTVISNIGFAVLFLPTHGILVRLMELSHWLPCKRLRCSVLFTAFIRVEFTY